MRGSEMSNAWTSVVTSWAAPAGYVTQLACRRFGELAALLGAGRQRQGDRLDLAVGLEILVRTGDLSDGDAPAVRIHARDRAAADRVRDELPALIAVGPEPVAARPLVLAQVGLG